MDFSYLYGLWDKNGEYVFFLGIGSDRIRSNSLYSLRLRPNSPQLHIRRLTGYTTKL